MNTCSGRWSALCVAASEIVFMAGAARAQNILRNPGFELPSFPLYGSGLLPDQWGNINPPPFVPDTYSEDGFYGLFPFDGGNFTGIEAHGGSRFIAGRARGEGFSQLVDGFEQGIHTDSESGLRGGVRYRLSGWMLLSTGFGWTGPGTYDVHVVDINEQSTLVGSLATISQPGVWEFRSIEFVTPSPSTRMVFYPRRQTAGGSFLALDDLTLECLGVNGPVEASPTDGTGVRPGELVVLSAIPESAGPYQWRRDGVPIVGGPQASGAFIALDPLVPELFIVGATVAEAGVYTCSIENDCGVITSRGVPVSVSNFGARFVAGSLTGTGFPIPLNTSLTLVQSRSGAGSGSTGGGLASAAVQMRDEGPQTIIHVTGEAEHTLVDGFTAVGTVEEIVFEVLDPVDFTISNLSTSTNTVTQSVGSYVPATLRALPGLGTITGDAATAGHLAPGRYGLSVYVESRPQGFNDPFFFEVVADWRLTLSPEPCRQDFNGDGAVNADDLGDYINCYFPVLSCLGEADFNRDGEVNADDLGDFINLYFGPGC
ncbi:MAG: hypothetical protein AB7K52_13895 [Phycisphaerales bacterium]